VFAAARRRRTPLSGRDQATVAEREKVMGIIQMIVVGLIVGLIARALMPGDQKMGLILTTLLGIAGSAVANFAGSALGWYRQGDNAGWIASIVGALVVLFVYGLVTKRS
jgi:uncharacterized membrane protein YeaQ/YmgE (transglycosylase-associated protein family)